MAYQVDGGHNGSRNGCKGARRFSNAFYVVIVVLCVIGFLLRNRAQAPASPAQDMRIAIISFITREQPYLFRSLSDKQSQ